MKFRKVKVERGDTLWTLAEKHMGSGQKWRDLFLMNAPAMVYEHQETPAKIGPNFIFEGQELYLVEDVEFEPSGN